MSESVLVSIKGAASFLGVSPWSVRAMIWNAEVPFVRVGRAHMVDRDDLLAWVKAHKTVAGSGTTAGTKKRARASIVQSKN